MIGLFIGSFNPPTLAHLEIALKLKKRFSKIIFVPVNSKDKNLVDIQKRISMLNIYTKRFSFLEIDDIMKDYSYLNYRIIDLLKDKYKNVTIIMGSDLLDKLISFDNYQYLLENYSFIVIKRKGFDIKKIIHDKYYNYLDKFEILNFSSNISSTMAREKLHNQESVKNILDSDILLYIKEYHLY